ncbi:MULTISPECIES: hypothetical protein [Methanobacterium]|uniref:hypothetical protein n=1 Tax=Methanobacterium TaxID=2160 RepID=UPI001C404AAB|nr:MULTISPECIES: hypothetical protein [Methanobacterium]
MVLRYETPLIEGIIERRKSQFTIDVFIDNEVVTCHCRQLEGLEILIYQEYLVYYLK